MLFFIQKAPTVGKSIRTTKPFSPHTILFGPKLYRTSSDSVWWFFKDVWCKLRVCPVGESRFWKHTMGNTFYSRKINHPRMVLKRFSCDSCTIQYVKSVDDTLVAQKRRHYATPFLIIIRILLYTSVYTTIDGTVH
jgi:hypothetical protein